MPSRYRRQNNDQALDEFTALIRSPQSRGLLFQIVGIIAAAGLLWVVVATILSLFNAWFIVGLAIIMGVVVFAREWFARRREMWIHQGYCAQCGYDLRATPDRCPECGRDARLDEPLWRRTRRELEAKLLASADDVEETEPLPVVPEIPQPTPGVRLITKRPPEDDAPIPLEGDEPKEG